MTTKERSEEATKKRPSSAGQWLIGLFVVLALAASLLMVFGNDFSIPATLAVIAALWAAVIGAVLVTKYRRQADVAESRSRDLRLVYELQLEREIAARRQYESDVESAIRHEIAAESNVELEELKTQVLALRASLEQLLGKPLPDVRAAIGLDRPRELGSGLAGAGYTTAVADDRVVADRDFATTAPPSDTGRHVPDEPQDAVEVDPAELTEIIPVVTDDPEDEADPASSGAESEYAAEPEHVGAEAEFVDDQYEQQKAQYEYAQYQQAQYEQAQYEQAQYEQAQYEQAQYEQEARQQQYQQAELERQRQQARAEQSRAYSEPPNRSERTGPIERVAYGAQAYEPPPVPPQTGPQPVVQSDGQEPSRRGASQNDDGAHSAGRPASELLSQLRAASEGSGRSGRRRRD